jgi:hypothetical protein
MSTHLIALSFVMLVLTSGLVLMNYTEEDSQTDWRVGIQKKVLDNNLLFNSLTLISIASVLYDSFNIKHFFQVGWVLFSAVALVALPIIYKVFKFLWIAIIPDILFGEDALTKNFAIPDHLFNKSIRLSILLMASSALLHIFIIFK